MKKLRIATRQSPLALWQARHVSELLLQHHEGVEVSLLELTTEGDRFLSAPLAGIGGKNLFVKEIEQALLDGRAEVAVHSLKDVTSTFAPGLMLAAVPEREDARDAWVSPRKLALTGLERNARIGTSSLRRTCQLLAARPDFEIVKLRGNVQTRLRRTREENLHGAMLAYAGLKRLGLEGEVTEILSVEQSLPAVGQGALAIECRTDDASTRALLETLDHADSRTEIRAERALLAQLEGGCSTPLAGYAVLEGEALWLRALVGSPDGRRVLRDELRGPATEAEQLGVRLAQRLIQAGAGELLAAGTGTQA